MPFDKMIDEWRWKVFTGEIVPQDYNQGWWDLRTEYQGIKASVERSEEHFDTDAKYHIPGNTPYTRYFLSFIMQFRFYKALCGQRKMDANAIIDYFAPAEHLSKRAKPGASMRLVVLLNLLE